MSNPHGSHPTRKRQRHSSQHPSSHNLHILPQLRLLAPKVKVQNRSQLAHDKIQDQQPAEGPDPANDVSFEQPATPQSCVPLKPIPSGHRFILPSPLQPDGPFSSPVQTQHSVVAPSTSIYSNSGPLASTYFPALGYGKLVSGVDTYESDSESVGLSTEHLLHGNSQPAETTQSQQGRDYLTPTLNAPEDAVWAATAQPAIDINQGQCSNNFTQDEYMLISSDTT